MRHENGHGSFLADRIDVYINSENKPADILDKYTAIGNAYINKEKIYCLNGSGSSFIKHIQPENMRGYNFKFEAKAENTVNAFFFCKQDDMIQAVYIIKNEWQEYNFNFKSDNSGGYIKYGFAINGADKCCNASIKNIKYF